MATKTKPKARRSRKSRAKPKGIEREITQHPFAPEAEVTVHTELDVDTERKAGRAPAGEGIGKAKVTKAGKLVVHVPVPGAYAVASRREHQEIYDYVLFHVKEA